MNNVNPTEEPKTFPGVNPEDVTLNEMATESDMKNAEVNSVSTHNSEDEFLDIDYEHDSGDEIEDDMSLELSEISHPVHKIVTPISPLSPAKSTSKTSNLTDVCSQSLDKITINASEPEKNNKEKGLLTNKKQVNPIAKMSSKMIAGVKANNILSENDIWISLPS